MARVLDLRSNGGELVLIGKALVLPTSNDEVVVGAEPMVGSARYNPEIGRIDVYIPIDNDLLWSPIVLAKDLEVYIKRTGDTMEGDLLFAPNAKLVADGGNEITPSITFTASQKTGLAMVNHELLVIADGVQIAKATASDVQVFGNLAVSATGFFDTVETRVANATLANVTTLEANAVLAANLAANAALIANLGANAANIANLGAYTANIANLAANLAVLSDLSVLAANIANLSANTANLYSFDASIANVANLAAHTANFTTIDATIANVANLFANSANLVLLAATSANLANLSANSANLSAFQANVGNVAALTANVGNIAALTAHSVTVVPEEEDEDLISQLDLVTQGSLWQVTHEADHSLTLAYQSNVVVTVYANGTVQGEHFTGSASSVTGADLAERYHADAVYEPGTVMVIGGGAEITIATRFADVKLAGVVSTLPGIRMNEAAGDDVTHPFIALKGRVPCKVVGPVRKGDLLVSSPTAGHAQASARQDQPDSAVVGRALQDFPGSGTGTIEIKV